MLSSRSRYLQLRCSRCLGHSRRTAVKSRRPASASASPLAFTRFQSTASNEEVIETISPSLLERARSIADEHKRLSTTNAESYDITIAKKIGELGSVTTALKEWEDAQDSLSELNALLVDPLSDNELRSLAESDIESTLSTLPSLSSRLKSSLIPPHPFGKFPCMIEIHPGAGGSEASIFAHELLTMYQSLCTRLSLPSTLASYTADETTPGNSAGMTDGILEITSPGAYGLLRTEAGVHRVQRVPATEKKGRTHTSAVSVLVLPSLPDTSSSSDDGSGSGELDFADPNSDYYVSQADVRSEVMRARGAGGQHVNKTESAVRLTHMPTGIVVAMQDSRSQHKNRERAWQILRAKIAQKRREEREAEIVALRRSVMGGVARTGREDKVRTYNFSQNRVTDHRSGKETNDLDGVLAGGETLEAVMTSVREWMQEGEVEGMIAEDEAAKKKEKQEKK